ncbi:MAG TPA: 4Fe-4S binding protein [Candidatus Paceibacterota bacterium]|nr:4Fe-4S binding protein [Verrucomicrobiota bacterium]HRY48517.1 4Fe-4S binding protein [Candidatus Paceibacterota bacterium]
MTRLSLILRFCLQCGFTGLLLMPLSAFGVERFPPPEFEEGYVMPPTTTPAPRAGAMEYVDAAVLLGTLSLASYFVLKKRSRRPIFGLMLFSLFYFGFYRKGCICAVGSIQDVTLAVFNNNYLVPLTVLLFFLAPLLFTLFFGRTFCAAVCPLGAIQDVMLVRPVKTPSWLEQTLGLLPWIYLGSAVLFAATGTAFIICQYDPFVSFFRRSGSFNMLALGAGFLALATVIGRPYCRFLCPYGALLSVFSRFSKWNVVLSPSDCIRCQLCDVACPFSAIREPPQKNSTPVLQPSWTRAAAWFLVALLLVGAGAFGARHLAVPFSKLHPTVALAERIAAEDAGQIAEPTDASTAFRQTGRPSQELFAEAWRIRERFVFGTTLLGAFIGLVFGIKLVALVFVRLPDTYEPDHAHCLSCGRCYTYCPKEIGRKKRLQNKKVIPLSVVEMPKSNPPGQQPA